MLAHGLLQANPVSFKCGQTRSNITDDALASFLRTEEGVIFMRTFFSGKKGVVAGYIFDATLHRYMSARALFNSPSLLHAAARWHITRILIGQIACSNHWVVDMDQPFLASLEELAPGAKLRHFTTGINILPFPASS